MHVEKDGVGGEQGEIGRGRVASEESTWVEGGGDRHEDALVFSGRGAMVGDLFWLVDKFFLADICGLNTYWRGRETRHGGFYLRLKILVVLWGQRRGRVLDVT